MNFNSKINELFRPVQPVPDYPDENVVYREISPDARLQPLIYCYWELKTLTELPEAFSYRVVADGCIDVFFQTDDPAGSFVMGFSKQHAEFCLGKRFNYFGIRFLPAAFPRLFNIKASELSHRTERLEFVNPKTSRFIEGKLFSGNNVSNLSCRFDRYFIDLVQKGNFRDDNRFFRALIRILAHSGELLVERDLDTGLSPRQLRRYFEFYIGDSAKTFSRVIRFQKVLAMKMAEGKPDDASVFFDLGYYDQPHFIREFRNFYGLTPGKVHR